MSDSGLRFATVEVLSGQTDPAELRVLLRVTNPSSRSVAVCNPDMGVPSAAMDWPFSNEVYQTALLISFGFLTLSVTDETGKELPREAIETWATPVRRPKLELKPGDSFDARIVNF